MICFHFVLYSNICYKRYIHYYDTGDSNGVKGAEKYILKTIAQAVAEKEKEEKITEKMENAWTNESENEDVNRTYGSIGERSKNGVNHDIATAADNSWGSSILTSSDGW